MTIRPTPSTGPIWATRVVRRETRPQPSRPIVRRSMRMRDRPTPRTGSAFSWFERALAGSPTFSEARLNLGIAYQQNGNVDKAIEVYRRVVASSSPDSREYGAASRLLAALGKQ